MTGRLEAQHGEEERGRKTTRPGRRTSNREKPQSKNGGGKDGNAGQGRLRRGRI